MFAKSLAFVYLPSKVIKYAIKAKNEENLCLILTKFRLGIIPSLAQTDEITTEFTTGMPGSISGAHVDGGG